MKGYYVLVAREELFEGEKLCLRSCEQRRIIKANNDYVYQVEDLRNGDLAGIHGTRLKLYSDDSLGKSLSYLPFYRP